MKKRGIQVFIAITMVLCLLIPSFPTGITATVEGISGTATPEISETEDATLEWIDVTPASAKILIGDTYQFTAKGRYWSVERGYFEVDITKDAYWSSDDKTVATVVAHGEKGGLATGVDWGLTSIIATLEKVEGSAYLEVFTHAGPLVSINVTPDPASISCFEGTQQFNAIGSYGPGVDVPKIDDRDITTEVAWSSSKPYVAEIDEKKGLATADRKIGITKITATLEEKKGSAWLKVCTFTKEELRKTEEIARELKKELRGAAGDKASHIKDVGKKSKPTGVILIIGTIAELVLSRGAKILEECAKQIQDPPSNYTEVFQIRSRTLDPWLPEPTTSFDFAAINFINSELRVIEEMEAVTVSLDRVLNALSVGDSPHYRLQIQAVLDYTTMLIADLTGLASSSAEFYEEWVKWIENTWGIAVTPEDLEEYQQRIATEGFSQEELQALKEGLLATDEDIEWIINELLSLDPVAEWGNITSALPELDDVILSGLPMFTGLISEAERILVCCRLCVSPCVAREVYAAQGPEVETLRDFRDEYLVTNPVGEALAEFYYEISPPIAEFIAEHPVLKPVVKVGLFPAVAIATVATNTNLPQKMAIGNLLVLVPLLLVGGIARNGGFPGRKKR